ncbi:MAG: 50S ribosomal protein L9 [Candidatus Cloacimonetes bacterium]|nr:50S ribosomal protein L9 [Candidatus Cloacimonadota bacterium]
MKIILTESIEKVGKAGQVITVKDGYARNYLIPKGYAILANAANLKKVNEIETAAKEKTDLRNVEFKLKAQAISGLVATFQRRADKDGKLFGSVSEVDIMHFLEANDVVCSKNQIVIDKPIKNIGEEEVKIQFTNEIVARLQIKVEEGE